MSGVYIHIPFCHKKCSYCDFYSLASTAYLKPTLQALKDEMFLQKNFFLGKKIDTIYIGGGTPSLLDTVQVESLFETMAHLWDLTQLCEVTFEANPDDLSLDYLKKLRQNTPINRLSMGVQSFDDEILKFMNRRHDRKGAIRAFDDARQAGFDNISLDLIYGVPTMSEKTWKASVDKILELSPEHISAYHLSIEPKTRFGMLAERGELAPVDENISERDYNYLCNQLALAGYEHYEISNFAKKGRRAVHNSSYWTGEKYLGLGAGAHSFNGKKRHWCEQNVKDYIYKVQYRSEILSEEDKYNEFIMLSFRQKDGLNIALLEKTFGENKKNKFLKSVQKPLQQGLIKQIDDNYVILEKFWLIADNILVDLIV